MRGMIKILSITADGKSGDFRLMKRIRQITARLYSQPEILFNGGKRDHEDVHNRTDSYHRRDTHDDSGNAFCAKSANLEAADHRMPNEWEGRKALVPGTRN